MRTIYFLIALNIVLAVAAIVLILVALNAQERLNRAEQRSYEGCVRGNVLREVARFAMIELGSPERAAKPALAEQPCDVIYPGGKP